MSDPDGSLERDFGSDTYPFPNFIFIYGVGVELKKSKENLYYEQVLFFVCAPWARSNGWPPGDGVGVHFFDTGGRGQCHLDKTRSRD